MDDIVLLTKRENEEIFLLVNEDTILTEGYFMKVAKFISDNSLFEISTAEEANYAEDWKPADQNEINCLVNQAKMFSGFSECSEIS